MTIQWWWIPNALTFLRVILIVPFAWFLWHENYWPALIVFMVAAVSDAFDGYLARRFNWRSRLGAIADPLADKALLITAYLMLSLTGVFPVWLFILVLGRDLLIVVGGLAYHYGIGRFDMQPSLLGKLNTLLQILVVLAVIVMLSEFPAQGWIRESGIALVTASTVASGIHYVVVWSMRAWRAKQH